MTWPWLHYQARECRDELPANALAKMQDLSEYAKMLRMRSTDLAWIE
jgi:hypothetical protein